MAIELPSKRDIRVRVITARAALDPERAESLARQLARQVIPLIEARGAATVAAYLSVSGEPGTQPLIDELYGAGIEVLLPLLREDFDLEWAVYQPGAFQTGRFDLVEPSTPSRGLGAIEGAGVIVCPGVAGTAAGRRLGRGGGSYDRALPRANPKASRCLLLYDDEVLEMVPAEAYDAFVDYVATPTRLIETSPGRSEHQGLVGR